MKTHWIRNIIVYGLVRCVVFCIQLFPYFMIRWVGWFVGSIVWIFAIKMRHIISANLKIAFPEWTSQKRNNVGRMSLVNLICTAQETFWFMNRPDRALKYVSADQEMIDYIHQTYEKKQAHVIIVAHFGNWEVAGIAMKWIFGQTITSVNKPFKNPYLNRYINDVRTSSGCGLIDQKGALKKMMKKLKEGGYVATLVDQNTKVIEGGAFVRFFGLSVPSSRAPAMLVRKMGCQCAMSGSYRTSKGLHCFFIHLPTEGTEEELTQAYMSALEKMIRTYPEQYLWIYKRFLYIPENCAIDLKGKYPFYSKQVNRAFYGHHQEYIENDEKIENSK